MESEKESKREATNIFNFSNFFSETFTRCMWYVLIILMSDYRLVNGPIWIRGLLSFAVLNCVSGWRLNCSPVWVPREMLARCLSAFTDTGTLIPSRPRVRAPELKLRRCFTFSLSSCFFVKHFKHSENYREQ
jgi:hypothetical protein